MTSGYSATLHTIFSYLSPQPVKDPWYVALSEVQFDRNILVLFSTILAGFISISVPLALSIVSRHTDEYKDKEIAENFVNHWSYRFQVYIVPVLVMIALLSFSLKVEKGWLVCIILLTDIISFLVFIYFLHILGQYATNFDTHYSNELKRASDRIVQKKNRMPLNILLNNLEKTAKISAMRISKDYTNSVVDDLNWIQANFITLMQLHDTDEHYFLSLIDTNEKYIKIKTANQDFSGINFSNFSITLIDQLPQEQQADSLIEKYQKVHAPFKADKIDELLLRYIQTIFTIWDAAIEKQNPLIQRYCVYTFVNWLAIIDRVKDEKVDYSAILVTVLDKLGYRNYHVLNNTSERLPNWVSLFYYHNYLDRIYSDDVASDNIEIYFNYLFRFLYQAVESKKYLLAEEFISRCIDSNYYPSFGNNYSELYSLVRKKMEGANLNDIDERLKPIPDLGFYKLDYIGSAKQFDNWEAKFDSYVENDIRPYIIFDSGIEKQIEALKKHAFKIYKFNRLQVTTLKLLSFCLFKGNYTLIKHALYYNQPSDSNAIQGNKEILPLNLKQILNTVSIKYEMEQELFGFWDGHHGIEPYLDQLLCILFYHRHCNHFYEEDVMRIVSFFCEGKLENASGKIDALKQHIERLKEVFEHHTKDGKLKEEFFKDDGHALKVKLLFAEIVEACRKALESIERNAAISEETKTRFFTSILESYRKKNYLNKLFNLYGESVDMNITDENSFGINEMVDRTAFINDWHVPYVGYVEEYGRYIAEQENRNALNSLTHSVSPIKLKKNKIAGTLLKYTGKDYFVILINIHVDMLLRQDENYTSAYKINDENTLVDGFYTGTYKDLPVFSLHDDFFGMELLILKKGDLKYSKIGNIVKDHFVLKKDFIMSFIDFGSNGDNISLQAMMSDPPLWLSEMFKENTFEMSNYLQKKVWIRIFKYSQFEKTKNAECLLFKIE